MGSGKSTVGPHVAHALGMDFVDLDQVVVLSAGCDLPRIFADEGERGFRDRERQALMSIAGGKLVVACGGGVVEEPENVTTMRAHGRVAWLDATVGVLAGRVGDGTGRPMLVGDPRARLTTLQRRRRKKYAAAAHRRFDAAKRPQELAKEIVTWWRSTS
jgi:shikimate kinase